jgi:DNA invertase Pin-like site-specific DNA recombinase
MKIGYARVSTRDQKADLQVDALKQAGCERIYQDIASGAKSARPELDKLLANVRPGDAVVIWKLDRLGRSSSTWSSWSASWQSARSAYRA